MLSDPFLIKVFAAIFGLSLVFGVVIAAIQIFFCPEDFDGNEICKQAKIWEDVE